MAEETNEKENKVNFADVGLTDAYGVTAVVVMYKTGVTFDPDIIGEAIFEDEEFGMIDPPCEVFCIHDDFHYITREMIKKGSLSLKEINQKFEIDKFINDLVSQLNLFIYDDETFVFTAVDEQNFRELFYQNLDSYSIDLIEYESGFDE